MLTKLKLVLTFSKQGNVFPTINRQFGGFGVNNISDDSKMKMKLSFELSIQFRTLATFIQKLTIYFKTYLLYSKRYYFHLLYIYIFDDFTRNSVCDLILLHAQKFNRACNKSVEDQGRRTRMGSVGNRSKLSKMAKLWQKMKKNHVQLKPISILVP